MREIRAGKETAPRLLCPLSTTPPDHRRGEAPILEKAKDKTSTVPTKWLDRQGVYEAHWMRSPGHATASRRRAMWWVWVPEIRSKGEKNRRWAAHSLCESSASAVAG